MSLFSLIHNTTRILIHEYRAKVQAIKVYQSIKKERLNIENLLPDVRDTIDYCIRKRCVRVFNEEFVDRIKCSKIHLEYDDNLHMFYVDHYGNKLYFHRGYTRKKQVINTYRTILLEQDARSPHRYLYENEDLSGYNIIECGSAEASFSLDCVEVANRVYIFEADNRWEEALRNTFNPWLHKVEIISKFLSREKRNGAISLAEWIESRIESGDIETDRKLFIKMDIEGFETEVIEDIKEILKKFDYVKLAVCVYHNKEDENRIYEQFEEQYMMKPMNGYIVWLYSPQWLEFPYFRRGVIRIEKKD